MDSDADRQSLYLTLVTQPIRTRIQKLSVQVAPQAGSEIAATHIYVTFSVTSNTQYGT